MKIEAAKLEAHALLASARATSDDGRGGTAALGDGAGGPVALSMDDGYHDNRTHLLPLLERARRAPRRSTSRAGRSRAARELVAQVLLDPRPRGRDSEFVESFGARWRRTRGRCELEALQRAEGRTTATN
jgi:hypothetical protein